jgi:tetratricopeptide (TPR) repeat protein
VSVYGYDSGSSRRRRGPLGKLWSVITWPFRAIERVEARVVAWAEHRRRNFRHKYRHSKVIAPLVGMLVWGLLLPFRLIWRLVTAPFRLFSTTAQTMSARRAREWMNLAYGLPAVVAGIGAFAVMMMVTSQAEELPLEYLRQAQTAFHDGHFEPAEVYLHRALQLDPDSNEASYLLARTLEQTGESRRAMAILDSLAPDDRRGDPRAHLRKAELLFSELRSRVEPGMTSIPASQKEWLRLLQHVDNAQAGRGYTRGEQADLNFFRGIIYYNMGEKKKAREPLERASAERREYNVALAVLYEDLNEVAGAQRARDLARAHFQNELNEDRESVAHRLALVDVILGDRDYDTAIRVLEEGRRINPDDELLRKNLADAFVLRFRSLPPGTDPGVQISLLEQALKVDPECALAMQHLINLGAGSSKESVRGLLEDLIALGNSAPLAHFALGVMEWEEQDSQTKDNAIWHLERAYKLDPDLAVVGNNLAWLLAHDEENPQLDRALALINSVLESRPDQLSYVETRGQIYVRLGRWNEAIDDLERALPKYNYTVEIHDSLAKAYENLGQESLAQKHRNVSANLQRMQQERR